MSSEDVGKATLSIDEAGLLKISSKSPINGRHGLSSVYNFGFHRFMRYIVVFADSK